MKGFKRVHNQKGKTRFLNLLAIVTWLKSTCLCPLPFLFVLGKPCPCSMHPHSMCVHAKAKMRNQQTSNGRERCEVRIKRHKADKRDRHGKHINKDASK